MSNDDLPAILVSAVDVAAASEIIRELISEGVVPSQTNGAGAGHGDEADEPAGPEGPEARGVAWRLDNKYYSAAVRLLAAPDRPARPPPPADLQAHLIYLTEDECVDESACARRAAAAAGRLARGGVRLVAARCAGAAPPPALAVWARAARYELVPLVPPPDDPDDDDGDPPEPAGVARLREALHAHPWPGLVRRGEHAPVYFADDVSSGDSSNSSWGSWRRAGAGSDEDEAGAVERAEQFAAALGALPAARGAGGEGRGEEGRGAGDAERRLRAEQLLGAFCRALGHPLPPPPPTD